MQRKQELGYIDRQNERNEATLVGGVIFGTIIGLLVSGLVWPGFDNSYYLGDFYSGGVMLAAMIGSGLIVRGLFYSTT